MKRQLIIVSVFLIALFFVNKKGEQQTVELISHQDYEVVQPEPEKNETPIVLEKKPAEKIPRKEIVPNARITKVKRDRRSPATTYPTVSHKALISSRLELAHMIYVIKKDQYDSSMGSVVREQGGFIFFESESTPPEFSSFVAVDNKNSKIYPISNTLKLQNVDQDKRFEILQAGFEEFYYSEDLKTMYVQAAAGKLFEVYDLASNLSLSPEIEIIRAFNRIR